jgi:DNA polymerase III delta prime subunit
VLRRGELGLTHPRRPKGSFLFLGPTGVGKTELTLTFSHHFFGENRVARFDMSEYQEQKTTGFRHHSTERSSQTNSRSSRIRRLIDRTAG